MAHAVAQQQVAELVTVAASGFHAVHQAATLVSVKGRFQTGRVAVLLIHCQRKSEENAISFLTRHLRLPTLH